jgi:hypothetical protein
MLKAFFVEKSACFSVLQAYSDFQIDELHRHNQNLVGTLYVGTLHTTYILLDKM